MLDMARNIVAMEVIAKIELWKNSNHTDQEIVFDDFMDELDFRLVAVQCHD